MSFFLIFFYHFLIAIESSAINWIGLITNQKFSRWINASILSFICRTNRISNRIFHYFLHKIWLKIWTSKKSKSCIVVYKQISFEVSNSYFRLFSTQPNRKESSLSTVNRLDSSQLRITSTLLALSKSFKVLLKSHMKQRHASYLTHDLLRCRIW